MKPNTYTIDDKGITYKMIWEGTCGYKLPQIHYMNDYIRQILVRMCHIIGRCIPDYEDPYTTLTLEVYGDPKTAKLYGDASMYIGDRRRLSAEVKNALDMFENEISLFVTLVKNLPRGKFIMNDCKCNETGR